MVWMDKEGARRGFDRRSDVTTTMHVTSCHAYNVLIHKPSGCAIVARTRDPRLLAIRSTEALARLRVIVGGGD